MEDTPVTLIQLSKHLFWDVDVALLDKEKHKKFIVQRVLEYGLLSDWLLIKNQYSKDELARIATSLRSLEPKALSFIAAYTGVPKEKFRCYTTGPSTSPRWNF